MIEQRIETLETRVAEIDHDMLDPSVFTDGQACKALQLERNKLQAELGPLEQEWTRRAELA